MDIGGAVEAESKQQGSFECFGGTGVVNYAEGHGGYMFAPLLFWSYEQVGGAVEGDPSVEGSCS